MSGNVALLNGVQVYVCNGGPTVDERNASDLIGEMYGLDTQWIALPVAGLAPEFFRLRSGVAGEIIQKLMNYRVKVAIVGDVSAFAAASTAFRDFVAEANRGGNLWFVTDMDELGQRLAGTPTPLPPSSPARS